MFDIIWTDPDKECVGERRARKKALKELQGKDRDTISSRRSSSSGEKPFGLFGSKSLNRATASLKSKPQSPTPSNSGLATPNVDVKDRRGSYFNIETISELPSDPVQTPRANPYFSEPFLITGSHSPIASSRGIVC